MFGGKTVHVAAAVVEKNPLHIASAYAGMQRICLGQLAVEEKCSKITAIPKVFDLLTFEG